MYCRSLIFEHRQQVSSHLAILRFFFIRAPIDSYFSSRFSFSILHSL